jgi:hypothetical protein
MIEHHITMPSPLNPDQLTPAASFHRMRLVEILGVAFEPEVHGQLGYDLLSTPALATYMRERAGELNLGNADRLND